MNPKMPKFITEYITATSEEIQHLAKVVGFRSPWWPDRAEIF